MDKFYELSEDTVNDFLEIFNRKSLPVNIKFQFIGSKKQKEMIKISKLSEQFVFLLNKEIFVSINEEIMDVFDKESVKILIEQELDKITIDNKGDVKLIKTDLNTFSSLVNKYGVEKIARANRIEELYHQQKKDGKDDFIA